MILYHMIFHYITVYYIILHVAPRGDGDRDRGSQRFGGRVARTSREGGAHDNSHGSWIYELPRPWSSTLIMNINNEQQLMSTLIC